MSSFSIHFIQKEPESINGFAKILPPSLGPIPVRLGRPYHYYYCFITWVWNDSYSFSVPQSSSWFWFWRGLMIVSKQVPSPFCQPLCKWGSISPWRIQGLWWASTILCRVIGSTQRERKMPDLKLKLVWLRCAGLWDFFFFIFPCIPAIRYVTGSCIADLSHSANYLTIHAVHVVR